MCLPRHPAVAYLWLVTNTGGYREVGRRDDHVLVGDWTDHYNGRDHSSCCSDSQAFRRHEKIGGYIARDERAHQRERSISGGRNAYWNGKRGERHRSR